MSFIYKRRLLCDNIDGMCFFAHTDPNVEHSGERWPYTVMFNNSIIKIYSPVHKILEKNLFRPIKDILSFGNHLFILFMDGNITEVLYNAGNIDLVSLIYIDEVGINTFIRADDDIIYIHYDRFRFGMHVLSRSDANALNKSAILENFDLKSGRKVKTGLHRFHEIYADLNNVKDVALVNDLIYFLYSPDLSSMCVLIVDLCSFAVLKNIKVDSTAFKLFKLRDTAVVVLSERVLYFLWVDFVIFTYCIPFHELADQDDEFGNSDSTGLFNTAEVVVNNSIFIFNGDDKIYRLHLCYAGHHIQSISTSVQRSFHRYGSIRKVFEMSNFLFLILENHTALLLQPQFDSSPKAKKSILLSEMDDEIDLYNTRVQIDESAEIAEETEKSVHTYALIKTHHSFGDIRYIFECDADTNREYLIVTDRLIRYFDTFTFKFTRSHKIGNYKLLMKAKDLFVLTNGESSLFFRWIDSSMVEYSGMLSSNRKEKMVEAVTEEYTRDPNGKDVPAQTGTDKNAEEQMLEHKRVRIAQTVQNMSNSAEYITNQETMALFYFDDRLVQVTRTCINVLNEKKVPINADQVKYSKAHLFVREGKTLRIYSLTSLFNDVEDCATSYENVDSFSVNGPLFLLCESSGSASRIKLFSGENTLFCSDIHDFCNTLENGRTTPQSDHGSEDESTDVFRIDECLVYQYNDVVSMLLKSGHVVALYEGFITTNSLFYFVKRRNLISFHGHALYYTRNFVFIRNNFVILTCNNRVQRITNSFDCVLEDAGVMYGISKKNIVEFKPGASPMGCLQKVHSIKNIDKIIRDEANGVYIFTFLPKTFKTDDTHNTDENEEDNTLCKERQELVMSTLSFNKLSIFKLPENELVTDLKIMNLSDANGDYNNFVIVILSQRTSNEILRGRILVFEVINVIGDMVAKKTKKALKLLGSERTKGPISCCAAVRGKIAVSLATKLMVYECDRNSGIVAIAFYDLYMYAVSLAVIKNYIIVGDIMMGLHFVYFQSEPVKLHLLSKSDRIANLGSLDFFNAGESLFITGIDKTGKVQIFSFSPSNLYSNGGEKLVKRQEFETYACFQSIKTSSYRSYASFFSSQNFLIALSYTQKNYGKIHDVLRKYRETKNFFGVNLKYQHREVCYKECVYTDLLLNFFNEPLKYQKSICERSGHSYEKVLHIIEDFLKL
ncbi:hypothetical protein VCUG_01066 [Vavraia culicis subsp. floridensis]|uniref:RSE1/DDB1/CPSF1 C-terminal domain-containing protein n=1 Tax=Vavraia culicis (isolate floridensis) TaxID=948595 RepID=L2GWF7_VAVCU|nr:uncharacterized protein VCUG_01066 [Vavraia culicis subsp. floridensis]ELA47415.1 hypothetical protein VCUG_01066 [Vavraia culicis subsp. floridensis]